MDEVESTQDEVASMLFRGEAVGVLFARNQTRGRGRFQRAWLSSPGESLTLSLAFSSYDNHPRPYLIGMAVACAIAGVVHCQVQWPNDLTVGNRKLGGILTELLPNAAGGKTPVVGVGLNLNQDVFPDEIANRATSLARVRGVRFEAEQVARKIVGAIDAIPEPNDWSDIEAVWRLYDVTPGKRYTLGDGKEGVAIGVGPVGELLCSVDGETVAVLAADAIFGESDG